MPSVHIAEGERVIEPQAIPHRRAAPRSEAREERGRLNLSWLVQLHWWAILGQVVIIAGAEAWSSIGLPVGTLIVLIGLEALGNVALGAWARRAHVTNPAIALVMVADAAMLTVLLDLTGGTANPFSTLYLVNVALAAVLLPPAWSWGLMGASLLGFGSLFLHEHFVGPGHHVRHAMIGADMMAAHLRGMWISFALAAVFVVFFVQRVSRALAARERELQQARVRAERREKLASLATLAAGAAHELSTPLSTIAVVAKELQRALPADASNEVRQDLTLVRDQVARCREILDRMSVRAGENVGESLARVPVRQWIDAALNGLPHRERVSIDVDRAAEIAAIAGPPRALADALRGLLKNALQASGENAHVSLKLSVADGQVRAAVLDRGGGMPPDVLSRVGEPFFTTKSPGEGMGLGLFLTRALAEQLGGEFHIASAPGSGTEARIDLPAVNAGERSTP